METGPSSPAQLELIDSHAHVDMSEFDADRSDMLARAQAAGVRNILAIGGAPGALASSMPFAERYDWIYAAAGIHPHEAKLATPEHYDELAKLAQHPKFLALGEIGLDYHYDHSPRDVQQRVFTEQLELARRAGCPIIIHCREAWPDCLALLDQHWRSSGLGGIFHCFSGTLEEARRGTEMGFMISFAGNLTFPKAQQIRDAALEVPLDHMLIETDCPYLAPVPHRGKRNEPAFVKETARRLGELRGLSMEEIGEQTSRNFYNFFKTTEIVESKVTPR